MKRLNVLFLLLCLATLLLACGVQGPIVEAPAAEMNLTAADLGEGFALTAQSGLAEVLGRLHVKPEDQGTVVDADRRLFVAAEPISGSTAPTATVPLTTTTVMATVLVYNAAAAADAGLKEVADGFKGLVAITLTLQEQAITQLGDQTKFLTVGVPERGAQLYLLLFRKDNVVGMVQVTGPAHIQPQWAVDLAQKMLLRIPTPVSK